MNAPHFHKFNLAPYERYISKGVCKCGAVKFAADVVINQRDINNLILAKVRELNEREGKAGMPDLQTDTITHDVKTILNEARKLRGKKCLTCEYAYDHEETHYCSLVICPSCIPRKVRPPFRPNPEIAEPEPRGPKTTTKTCENIPENIPESTVPEHEQAQLSDNSGQLKERRGPPDPAVVSQALREMDRVFPSWNESWTPDVKCEWLRTFKELAMHGVSVEVGHED